MFKKNTLRFCFSICLVFCFGFGISTSAQFYSAQTYEGLKTSNDLSALYSNQFSDSFAPEIWKTALNKPETVPDRTAQSLFFLTISKFIDEGKEQFVRNYIKLMGLVNCLDSQCSSNVSEQDVEKILLVAREYQNKIASLDIKALEFKRNNDSQQLSSLQKQKLQELRKAVQKLSATLSSQAFSQFQDHINFRVKPKVKVVRKNSSTQSNLALVNQMRPEDPPPDDTGLITEMSDVWVASENDSMEVLPEGSPLVASTTIIGVGIFEADYNADIYQSSTTVSIVSNGNTLSTNTATGTFSSVAETQYTIETDFGAISPEEEQPEIQYDIQSVHSYSNSPESYNVNFDNQNSLRKSVFQRKSEQKIENPTNQNSTNLAFGFYSYSYASIGVSLRYTGYLYEGNFYGGCSGIHHFGYSGSCPFWDGCQRAVACSNGVSRGIQGYGYKFRAWGYSWCRMVLHLLVPFRPHCR